MKLKLAVRSLLFPAIVLIAGIGGYQALAERAPGFPAAYSPDDANACTLLARVHRDIQPRGKRKAWQDVVDWWDAVFLQRPHSRFGMFTPEVRAKLSVEQIAAGAEACRAVSKAKSGIALRPHTETLFGPIAPPAPVQFNVAQLFPDQPAADEDEVDCAMALLSTQSRDFGLPEDQRTRFEAAYLKTPFSDYGFFSGENWKIKAAYRSRHMEAALSRDEVIDVANRCLARRDGQAIEANPYRAKLLGPDRMTRYLARRESDRQEAARAAERARLAQIAAAEREEAERPLRELSQRCDAVASEGVERAGRNMQAAYRMAETWLKTGRYGTNYAWEDFERACRSIASTERTLENMSCPGQYVSLVRSTRSRFQLDLGNGGASYCREDWR